MIESAFRLSMEHSHGHSQLISSMRLQLKQTLSTVLHGQNAGSPSPSVEFFLGRIKKGMKK